MWGKNLESRVTEKRTRADPFNKSFKMKCSYVPQTTSSGTWGLLETTSPQKSHKASFPVSSVNKRRNQLMLVISTLEAEKTCSLLLKRLGVEWNTECGWIVSDSESLRCFSRILNATKCLMYTTHKPGMHLNMSRWKEMSEMGYLKICRVGRTFRLFTPF